LNWVANPSFKFNLENNLSVLMTESEARPTKGFTALSNYVSSFNSGLLSWLKIKSIYNSIAEI